MYCDKCGGDNSEAAKFCRKCGQSFEADEETRVAMRRDGASQAPIVFTNPSEAKNRESFLEGDEAEIFSIRPTLKFVKAGYLTAALGALLLVALTSAYLYQLVSVSLSVLTGMLLFLIPAYYHLRLKLVRYRLTDSNLKIDSGLIARTTRSVPIRRIQDVTLASTLTQRMLGLGNVVIDNASEEGGKAVLRNIDRPRYHADILLKQIRRLDR